MTYSLNTIVLDPLSKNKPKNAVILCHGYGGDGNDISILANYWKAHLPHTIFICPDAPEKCAASPTGFQWFDLMDQTPEQILAKSLVAENKLNKLIDEVKEKNNLNYFQLPMILLKLDLVLHLSSQTIEIRLDLLHIFLGRQGIQILCLVNMSSSNLLV